jgi:hypothetical protein
MPDGVVGLADAIEALRVELALASQRSESESLRFRAGPVEVTFQAVVTASGTARAGVRWWVVDAGAEGTAASTKTQTIRLVLEPVLTSPSGAVTELLVEDEDASVAGREEQLGDSV